MTQTESAPKSIAGGPAPRRILIVDDHPVFRRGMMALLSEHEDFTVCGEACNAREALDAMRSLQPDVVLVDISLPGMNGIELVKLMLAERPTQKILVLSMHDESLYAVRALRAGARGYVMKAEALDHVVMALGRVMQGGHYLSPALSQRLVFKAVNGGRDDPMASPVNKLSDRELEVLQHLGKGESTREIAAKLNLSVKTIETHRMHIKEKLGIQAAAELVRFAIEWKEQQGS